ncbi:exported hypothetical protein [Candidatus Sulfopaludibacter sp. SbA4]|nr:exported hypothetical protein [Candidatus Sulfopaludibacter sp. SbA4]
MGKCAGIAAWTLACAIALASDQAPYMIADFEAPTALQNWRSVGGTLSLGPGHRGHGAVLQYRLAGAPVEAMWMAASPLPKMHNPAISLWIRFPPEVEVFLVAKDTSGRALRFPIPAATLEHPKAGDWQYTRARIKGQLAEIAISVQSLARVTVEGSVSFDDIQLRESPEIFSIDAAVPVSPPPPESVELAPRLGVNIHLLQDDPALDQARAAGFRFVRMDMLWSNVERGGRFRFFAYDALLRALDARGMGVLWILDYGHPDHGGSVPRTLPDIAAFGRFAEAAAARFKGRNVRYEIWNEPDTSQFWGPSPNASEYAALLREAVAAIRRADPSARVSSGGLSRLDIAFLSRAVDTNLAAGLSAIGIHPYPKAGPETIAPELAILREWAARAFGERLEIWDTEWGYSSANAPKEAPSNGHTEAGRRRQAVLAVRELLTVWAAGLPLAVWYDLRDDGPDPANPEHNYGLLDASDNEKPAMRAIGMLMGAVRGRKYAGMIQQTPAGIHAMRLDGAKDTAFIVWSDLPGDRRTVEFARPSLISATDLMGKSVKVKDGPSGRARVEIDDASGPIYAVIR